MMLLLLASAAHADTAVCLVVGTTEQCESWSSLSGARIPGEALWVELNRSVYRFEETAPGVFGDPSELEDVRYVEVFDLGGGDFVGPSDELPFSGGPEYTLGDLNQDGANDLVRAWRGWGLEVEWSAQAARGEFDRAQVLLRDEDEDARVLDVVVADVDGSGEHGIGVLTDSGRGWLLTLRDNGRLDTQTQADWGGHSGATAIDVDGDGVNEVLLHGQDLVLWRPDGQQDLDVRGSAWVADTDADGDSDVIVRSGSSTGVLVNDGGQLGPVEWIQETSGAIAAVVVPSAGLPSAVQAETVKSEVVFVGGDGQDPLPLLPEAPCWEDEVTECQPPPPEGPRRCSTAGLAASWGLAVLALFGLVRRATAL